MRHQMGNRKLGRTSSHRKALFRNQITSLIQSDRIVTTLAKAKEVRPLAEKLVTLGKDDTVQNRRQVARTIADKGVVRRLFEEVSPRFAERPGGYTRIIKLGPRRGDGAEMAILEFVDFELGEETAAPEKPAKKAKTKSEKDDESAETEAEETPKKKKPAKKSSTKKAGGTKSAKGGAKKSAAKKAPAKKAASKSSRKSGGSKKKS